MCEQSHEALDHHAGRGPAPTVGGLLEHSDRPTVNRLLRTVGPGRLARGLELRPDLVVPRPPAAMGELADRVSRPRSVEEALSGCDRWCRQLVEVALVLRGPTSAPAIAALVRTAGGDVATEAQVDEGVERLADRLLLFVDPERRIWLNPGLVPLVPRPCGLGPPAAELLSGRTVSALREIVATLGTGTAGRSKVDLLAAVAGAVGDADTLERLLAAAPPAATSILRHAHAGYVDLPFTVSGRSAAAARAASPHAWLLARGLLVDRAQGYGYGYGQAEVPREVGLALRRGFAVEGGVPEPPLVAGATVGDASELDRRAAGRAGATVRSVAALLGLLGEAPAATLKSGGLGAREVRRLAKGLDRPVEEAYVLLEVAAAAGLISTGSYEPIVPVAAAEAWLDAPSAERWLALARAWLDAPGIPSVAGREDPTGRVVPGLVTVNGVDGRRLRRATLDVLAAAAPGERASCDLAAAVGWAIPAAVDNLGGVAADLLGWTVAEAADLGLALDGALTSLGRLLHAGDHHAAAEHAAALLVDAPAEVILQADLTAVVDAAAPQRVVDELRLLADTESTGSAVVLRFSARSVRRALDAGRDADQILAFLAEHATRGVPQPLEYLVTDTARRWGSVRLGAVTSYVRSDDPVLLEEAVRHRRLAKLGLRLLAPTVAVSKGTPAELLAALRDAGFLPVEEDASGVALPAGRRRERVAAPAQPRRNQAPETAPVDVRALVEALLAAGDEPDPAPPGPPPSGRGRSGRRTLGPGDLDLDQFRDLLDGLGPTDAGGFADMLASLGPADLQDWFGPGAARALESLLDEEFGEELGPLLLNDEADADLDLAATLDILADLSATGGVVELGLVDPESGRESAVTGLVAGLDVRRGRVSVEREPDGAIVIVDPADVFEIRVLGTGGPR